MNLDTFRRRRLVAIGALVAVVAVVVVAVLVLTGGDSTTVPEGGSSFGAPETGAPAAIAPARAAEQDQAKSKEIGLPPVRAAAQLFLVGFGGTQPTDPFFTRLRDHDWGGVLLDSANYTDPQHITALSLQARTVARAAGHIPPLVGAAQAGGADNAFGNLPPIGQRRQTTPALARQQALLAARQLRVLGLNMALAPNADVGYSGGPYAHRAFSDNPAVVARQVRAAVTGWQAGRVAPAVGHFPGEGSASQDPADGAATVGLGLDALKAADMRVFAGVAKTAPAIAMSGALYAGLDAVTPATLLPQAVALLRGQGFRGVVLSANLPAATLATGGTVAEAAVDALKAGCDLLLVPGDAADEEAAYQAVLRAIRTGALPAKGVRDSLRRIAALKRAYRVG